MKTERTITFLAASVILFLVMVLVIRGLKQSPEHSPEVDPSDQRAQATKQGSDNQPRIRPKRPTREADRMLRVENVKTDISLSKFPANEYQRMPSPAGKAAGGPVGEAYIHVPSSGRRVALEANQIGEYPTMQAKPNETVGVRLSLDAVKSGTPVRVVIMDGGSFPIAQGVTQVLKTEKGGVVGFEFTVSPNIGYHRILVQAQGQPSRILNFDAIEG